MTGSPRHASGDSGIAIGGHAIAALLVSDPEQGLRRLLAAHAGKVRWLLRNRFGDVLNDADLAAVLNEATFRVYRSIRTFDPGKGSLGTWFWSIARNTARDMIRGEAPHAHLELNCDDCGHTRGCDGRQEKTDSATACMLSDLQHAIDALPQLQRRIIQADLAAGDVADAEFLASRFNTTKASIYTSRSRARATLREAMIRKGHYRD